MTSRSHTDRLFYLSMKNDLSNPDPVRPQAEMPPGSLWFDRRGLCSAGIAATPHADVLTRSTRLELRLALAFGRRLPARLLTQVFKAAEDSQRGDDALANLRLAFAGLSRLPARHDLSARLGMADTLLARGVAPKEILDELTKFDPNQPRVPAGSGPASGRWTSGGAASASNMSVASNPVASTQRSNRGATETPKTAAAVAVVATATRAAPLFAPEVSAGVLAALSGVAAAAGAAIAVGGVLFVPWQRDTSSTGSLPNDTEHTYAYNSDDGLLQVRDAAGNVLAAGHKDKSGVFHDYDTGVPFARELNGSLMFDAPTPRKNYTEGPATAASSSVRAATDEDEDDEALCPVPGPDQPGSEKASDRAKAYQEQISRMINPERPLQYGEARNLINPITGKLVHFDECDEQTGTMIEAKGASFVRLLSFEPARSKVTDDWLDQSFREISAAGSRQVDWYFAEEDAANYARALFAQSDQGRERIVIHFQPEE